MGTKDNEINLKCCGNCIHVLTCGFDFPWVICKDWTFDGMSRLARLTKKTKSKRFSFWSYGLFEKK
jgi:hypothetical protein